MGSPCRWLNGSSRSSWGFQCLTWGLAQERCPQGMWDGVWKSPPEMYPQGKSQQGLGTVLVLLLEEDSTLSTPLSDGGPHSHRVPVSPEFDPSLSPFALRHKGK